MGSCAHVERLLELVEGLEHVGEDSCVARVRGSGEEVLRRLRELGVSGEELEVLSPKLDFSVKQGLKLCPVCSSPRLIPLGLLGVTPTLYVCSDCGYSGYIVLEVSLE